MEYASSILKLYSLKWNLGIYLSLNTELKDESFLEFLAIFKELL